MQLQKYIDYGRGLEIIVTVVRHSRILVIPDDGGVLDWLECEGVQDIDYFPDSTTTQRLEDLFVFDLPFSDDVSEFLRALERQLRVLDYELDTVPSGIDSLTGVAVGTVS